MIRVLSYLFNLSFMEAFCVVLPYLVIVTSSPLLIMSKSEKKVSVWHVLCGISVSMSISFPDPLIFHLSFCIVCGRFYCSLLVCPADIKG